MAYLRRGNDMNRMLITQKRPSPDVSSMHRYVAPDGTVWASADKAKINRMKRSHGRYAIRHFLSKREMVSILSGANDNPFMP